MNTKDLFFLFSTHGVVLLEDALYPPTFLDPDEPVANAFKLFRKSHRPMAVVRDKDGHKYLIHDRDRIFAKRLDDSIRALGLEVLRSPFASPKANATCERVIGTIRRECLDWMIPTSEAHLRSILREWVTHYNCGRPHGAIGPGVPDPPPEPRRIPRPESRHRLAVRTLVLAKSVLGGLHHEYSLAATSVHQ